MWVFLAKGLKVFTGLDNFSARMRQKYEKKPSSLGVSSKKSLSSRRVFCACGEIGRRARLRIWCRETCRFESYQAHHNTFLKENFLRGRLSFLFARTQFADSKRWFKNRPYNYLRISRHFRVFLRSLLEKTRSLLGKICSLLVFPSCLLRNGRKFRVERREVFSAPRPLYTSTS